MHVLMLFFFFFLRDLGILIKSYFFKFFPSNQGKRVLLLFFLILDLAVSFFQVSKENTEYERHNNSMKLSTAELP